MSAISLLVLRDLRRFGLFAVPWMILFFIQIAFSRNGSESFMSVFTPLMLWGSWGILIAPIIHDARPSGSVEFWMTRPISGGCLFTAKLISIIIISVVAPVLVMTIAKLAGFINNPWIVDGRDGVAILELFPNLLVIALFLMSMASLTRSNIQYACIVLCFGFIIPLIVAWTLTKTGSGRRAIFLKYPLEFKWVMIWFNTTGLICIIHNQYIKRNRRTTVIFIVILLIIASVIWRLWPTAPLPGSFPS